MSAWRQLISEAHRRSLWQVLGIYLMGSWVGFQVVLDLVEGIGLPSWLPGLAATLFVIGLPIVLATAFVQQGLPGAASEPGADTLDPTLFPGSRSTVTDASPEAAASLSARAPRSRMSGFLTWRRAIVGGVTAFAVLGAVTAGWLALRAIGVGPMASLLAAAELEENDRILIAEFDPRGADSTLAAVVTDAFRIDFARSTVMRSVAPAEVQDVLRRMGMAEDARIDPDLARQIALRDGISAYVTGEVSAVGSSFLVSARLIGTSSGEVLVVLREKANEADDLIDAVDRMSTTLRERTGESLRTIRRAEPLAKVTTPSLEALTAYTQGLRASSVDGDPERSLELHQQAVRLDTAFAAAHRAIGIHWYNRGESDLSIQSLERALRHADRMTELERASAYSALHLTRSEFADAAAALERVIALDPDNFAALNNLGLTYAAMKDHERADHYYRRAVQADTGRFFAYTNLGEHLVMRGRYEEAEEALRAAAVRAPQSAWPVVALAQVPYHAGDAAEAEKRLRDLIEDPASPLGIQMRAGERLYLLLRTQGRIAEAKALLRTHIASTGGGAEGEVYAVFNAVWDDLFLFDRADDMRRHVPALRAAAAQPGTEDVQVDAAIGCAWAGDAECARTLLANRGSRSELKPWSTVEVRAAHAGIARAEGDLRRALQVLRETRTNCEACELPLVGYLYEELEQPDSAATAYERYIATPSMDRLWGDAALPVMHEMLAEYYEQRGDVNTAAQHYARVIALWQNADPPLQPRVAVAQQRLAQLQPDR
jgi:tetratricopeptide (TPR) repeat protein